MMRESFLIERLFTIGFLLWASACTLSQGPNLPESTSSTTDSPIVNAKDNSEGKQTGIDSSKRCVHVSPKATTNSSEPSSAGLWNVSARKYDTNAKVSDELIGSAQSDAAGQAEICVPSDFASAPLIIAATNSVSGITVTRYLAPADPASMSSAEASVIDPLTTHITKILSQIYELPFSGALASVSQETFETIEKMLRSDSAIKNALDDGSLSLETTRTSWNKITNLTPNIGKQLGCLNSQMPSGSFSIDSDFVFENDGPQVFSQTSNTSLNPDGTLNSVAGAALVGMSVTINGVNLNAKPFDSMKKLAGSLSGAHLTAHNFDPLGQLDATLTMVHLSDGHETPSLIPCVAGIISVTNNASKADKIDDGSAICFDAVGSGKLFRIPSNGSLGDEPNGETQFMVFGNDSGTTSFVLGVPGVHNRTQNDDIRITISGNKVCMTFDRSHPLAQSSEIGDTASALWYLCQVTQGEETLAASQAFAASRAKLNIGSHVAHFGEALDRNVVAAEIARTDFMNNPSVMTFLKSDVRDSFVNYYQGNKANVFFSGKGLSASYTVYYNGGGNALAGIFTGPEGQWSGGINLPSAKVGDFLRFKASDSSLQAGSYFDIPLVASCDAE